MVIPFHLQAGYQELKPFTKYPNIFVTLQYNNYDPEIEKILKMSYSIDENNLVKQDPFTEKAALIKLWNVGIEREPFLLKEFYINRPFFYSIAPEGDHAILNDE